MNLINFFLFVLFFLASFGVAQDDFDDDDGSPDPPLPSYIRITCTGHDLDVDGRISTTARLMDWCYCGHTLNSGGRTYAGMSRASRLIGWRCGPGSAGTYFPFVVLHSESSKQGRTIPGICSHIQTNSKHSNDPCDDFEQWYWALGNVTDECSSGKSGIYCDSKQQKAWYVCCKRNATRIAPSPGICSSPHTCRAIGKLPHS